MTPARRMEILVLSQYTRAIASSRVRFYQYADYLRASGIHLTIAPLLTRECVDARLKGRRPIATLARTCLRRLLALVCSRRFDLLWVEAELFPWLPAWAEALLAQLGIRYVVEYDDAVFHRYDQHPNRTLRALFGRKVDTIMRRAALVIAGNEYLADRARHAGAATIECLPSVVDLARYHLAPVRQNGSVTIGWIGSPFTVKYLASAAPALAEMRRDPRIRIVIVGGDGSALAGIPIEARGWSEATEVADIQEFDVGIMPLDDGPWERGKCGYKLIQYMACGKPTVASPVGVNSRIVRHGVNGFLATSTAEWVAALTELCRDAELRQRLGAQGRRDVEQRYSLAVTLPRLRDALERAARV